MIEKGLFIHGIYPRSEALVGVSRGYDRGRKTIEDLKRQQEVDRESFLEAQEANGFTFFEDGKFTWQDMFRPFAQTTTGLSFDGGITRWFDNNTFFRKPVITGPLVQNFSELDAFFPQIGGSSQWKVTLPSPMTFARLSKDVTTTKSRETLENITQLMVATVSHLEQRGVAMVQLNEPYLVYQGAEQSEIDEFVYALRLFDIKNRRAKLAVHFPFGDASVVIRRLEDERLVDIVGVDLLKTNIATLPPNMGNGLITGVVDGRSSPLEAQSEVVPLITEALNRTQPHVVYVSTNTDLEFLPENVARQKLSVLKTLYDRI